ncbi:armadillo-type protein [Mycena galopus ATCC 62051]|nr:armadillo-type protein [Mycena galopus ATCC 62051]
MSLLRNKDSAVIVWAVYTLSEIAQLQDGAQAVVNARATDYISILLQSPRTEVRGWTCQLVGILSSHDVTAPAMLDMESCMQIVALLCDKNGWTIACAVYALSWIAQWKDGAQAIVNAKATEQILLLLESPTSEVQQWTCKLVGNLAAHESTVQAILDLKVCVQIVSLLHERVPGVIPWAVYTLSKIVQTEDSVQAIVDAKAMDYILPLLESPNLKVQGWTCELVGGLAIHKPTVLASLELKPSAHLASLLPDHVLTLLSSRDPEWLKVLIY